MNQYWIIAFLLLLGGVFFLGDRYGANSVTIECDRQESAQKDNTIAAEQHVIGETQIQNKISQESENAYHSNLNAIDTLYGSTSLPITRTTSNSVRSISSGTCGVQTSKKYKLTLKQCDDEEAKCNALWNWAKKQAAVK